MKQLFKCRLVGFRGEDDFYGIEAFEASGAAERYAEKEHAHGALDDLEANDIDVTVEVQGHGVFQVTAEARTEYTAKLERPCPSAQ